MDREMRTVIDYLKLRCYSFEDNETITGIANLPDEVQATLISWILHS
jgi:hypothetical protein